MKANGHQIQRYGISPAIHIRFVFEQPMKIKLETYNIGDKVRATDAEVGGDYSIETKVIRSGDAECLLIKSTYVGNVNPQFKNKRTASVWKLGPAEDELTVETYVPEGEEREAAFFNELDINNWPPTMIRHYKRERGVQEVACWTPQSEFPSRQVPLGSFLDLTPGVKFGVVQASPKFLPVKLTTERRAPPAVRTNSAALASEVAVPYGVQAPVQASLLPTDLSAEEEVARIEEALALPASQLACSSELRAFVRRLDFLEEELLRLR